MSKRERLHKLIVFFSILAILCFGLCAHGVFGEIGVEPTYWQNFTVSAEASGCILSLLGLIVCFVLLVKMPPPDKDS